jgi:hypothetical protein
MPKPEDLQPVYIKLQKLLMRFEKKLTVKKNDTRSYYLDAGYSEKFKREIFFGAVQIKKNYVSFYLMPVYMFPELLKGISTGLKRRMQGKSCFNFTAVDQELFSELAQLTQKGLDRFRREKLL